MAEIASFGVDVDKNTKLAQNAQDTADEAGTGIGELNDPNKLAPAEKATLKRKYDTDVLLYGMDTKKLTDNHLSTSEIDSAMSALTAYMTPLFANMTSTDTVDRDALNTVYKNFDTADKNADSAFTNMVSSAASGAMVAGNQASVAGSEAVVAGNNASSAASSAAIEASNAVVNATSAQTSATTAISTATSAASLAVGANQSAGDATTVANTAMTNANTAMDNANTAMASANSALSNANNASTLASSAGNNANNAILAANSASTNANNAINAANSAGVNANVAMSSASVALDKVNGMSVGGTNYLLNSANFGTGWSTNGTGTIREIINETGVTNKVVHLKTAEGDQNFGFYTYNITHKFVSGDTVTYSIMARGKGKLRLAMSNGVFKMIDISSDDYKKISVTATLTGDSGAYSVYAYDDSELWIHSPKFESGSIASDWSPAPEDVQTQITNINGQLDTKVSQNTFDTLNGTVTSNSTDILQNKSDIGLKANQTTVDTIKQTVDSQATSITENASEIALKADQSTVDSLNKSTTANSTAITENANSIALKADQTDVDTINKTVTDQQTSITQNASDIALKADESKVDTLTDTVTNNASKLSVMSDSISGLSTKTQSVGDQLTTLQGNFNLSSQQLTATMSKVDNMASGGGTNLITNSNVAVVLTRPDDNLNYPSWVGKKIFSGLTNGETYTFSTLATITSANNSVKQWGIRIFQETGNYEACRTTLDDGAGKRQSYTFTVPDDGKPYDVWVYAGIMGGGNATDKITVALTEYQLETGVVAHDWSPAPEDQATVTALTQVKQTAEGASQLSKDNQGNILALQSTAKGLQTSVSNAATKDQLNILSDTFSNEISSATSAANSKMIQTINNAGIGFTNPDGSTFQMNLSADGTALLDFSKIMLNGATNIANGTIGTAQIADAAITNAKIGKLAVGTAQIADLAVTSAKVSEIDAGLIKSGTIDTNRLNADAIIANVINGKTITGITINTPTLSLGLNGTLTTDFDISQPTGFYAPKKGTGTLTIKTGVINSNSQNMSRYLNTADYWYGFDDNGNVVKDGTNPTVDDYAPGYEKHDIMKSNGNVLNRSYLDAMALVFTEGGNTTYNTMLTGVGLETAAALLHKDLTTDRTFKAALGTDNTYGFSIGNHVIAPMIQANSYTYAANMFISSYGTMGSSTSTKVNKLNITDVPDMLQKGYNLLTLNPRQWFDKTSVEAYADVQAGNTDSVESVVDIKPVSGMVAEEVASAGLDDYVIKDENNKVQGLAYDRLWTLLLPVLRDMNDRLNEAQLEITKLKGVA